MENVEKTLPEEIMHHILSYLTPKDAAWARLLSKAWFTAWQSSPSLCIDEPNFYREADEKFTLERREKYFKFVSKVLLNYRDQKFGITQLKLKMKRMDRIPHLVDNWIEIALHNGLKKLEIRDYRSSYRFPSSILEAGSLVDLDLHACNIERQVTERGVQCRNLRRLALKLVDLSDDEVFDRIISSCPLIEYLEISLCEGLKKIKVTNLENLQTLYVRCGVLGPWLIEVEAPNLEYFKCEQRYAEKTPCVLNLFPCQNLKCLELADAGISDIFFPNLAMKLPHLEELIIRWCNALERLNFSSNSLRLLKLEYNGILKELQVDAPKIVRFEYLGNSIPRVLFTSASVNWESKILLSTSQGIDNPWFFRLKAFLTSLITSKIFLKVKAFAPVSFNADQIVYSLLHPRPTVESLSLDIKSSHPADFSALVNGFFWVCRPQIIQQWWFNDNADFVRFLHEMLMDNRYQDHPNCQSTKFWRKDLKEIRVLSLKTTGPERQHPELLDWSKDWSKKTGVEWLQHELLDWEVFLNPCNNFGLRRIICFSLGW